jgi:hypothetical protein
MYIIFDTCCSSTGAHGSFIRIFWSGFTGYQQEVEEEAEEWSEEYFLA